ncbi:hypothetical protein SAMN04488241_1217 [Sphingomonas rubra]|uniref:Uncharacterized protein n=2 Tax=Sphingomonas rubra TaxID=634430 RepID=A0A1I5UZ92_9SPHN|nr:hypothetical protein SAMN04488241_1217 [Sphingomonas rubra]
MTPEEPSAPAPAPQTPDFLSDEQMAAMAPEAPVEAPTGSGPVISDDQMERMANPDHAAVNALVRDAVNRGMSKAHIIELARQNGYADADKLGAALDPALAWRKRHGDYAGYVDLWHEDSNAQPAPDLRTTSKNEVSSVDALGAGIGQGLTFGFADELGAGIGALGNSVAGVFGAGTGEGVGEFYARVRDENRDYLHDAEEQHPYAYGGGQIAGAAPTALIGGLGASGARLVGRAALEGAAYGAGSSEADNVGDLASDTATGAAVGGLTAGAMNRAGAVISPRVAPLVDRLMRAGAELTPTQVLRAGGPVSRTVGGIVEKVGKRGVVTSEAMSAAEGRAVASVDALQTQQDAAVAAAKAAGLNATPRHPDLIADARRLTGKKAKETTNAEMLGNMLLGYSTGGSSLAADAGMAALYTKPGARIANSLLTGRQGPVPKSVRGILTKVSPLAGNEAAINTDYTQR